MGEIRVLIPDELHTDILELGKENNRRLPEEVTILLVEAVARHKHKRPSMTIRECGTGQFYPNGEPVL
jgi:hypothetical protein